MKSALVALGLMAALAAPSIAGTCDAELPALKCNAEEPKKKRFRK